MNKFERQGYKNCKDRINFLFKENSTSLALNNIEDHFNRVVLQLHDSQHLSINKYFFLNGTLKAYLEFFNKNKSIRCQHEQA